MKARVEVKLKHGVLDPQGKAIEGALHNLGFADVNNVRVGKLIELDVSNGKSESAIEEDLQVMCEKLLANTVIESYNIVIEK